MPALQAYTTQGSPAGTTSDAWQDAPTTPATGTSAALPDNTEMMVFAIGQARNDGGNHQGELEARVGTTRIGLVAHRSTYNDGNGAAGGAQLCAIRRVTTGVGDTLNFRQRSSLSGAGTLIGSLLSVAWPLTSIPASLRHHSESVNDDAAASQPPDVVGWVPAGTDGAGQLRFTPAETGEYLVMGSCELFPLPGMAAADALTARLAYREASTPTWTFIDTDDYFLRDPDPSLASSRTSQGYMETIPVVAGTEYVVAIVVEGAQAGGLMGIGRIGVHAFAPSVFESVATNEVGNTVVGGSATLDVAGASVTLDPPSARNYLTFGTFASSRAGQRYWSDHFLSVGADAGAPYGQGIDNFGADQSLRIMGARFLAGVDASTTITPRVTNVDGATAGVSSTFDRIALTAFSLYAPNVAGDVDVDGEAVAVGEAVASVAVEAPAVLLTGTAHAVAEATGALSVDLRLQGEAAGEAESEGQLRLDHTIGAQALAQVIAAAELGLDVAIVGETSSRSTTSATVVEAVAGLVDIRGDVVTVVAVSGPVALDHTVAAVAAGGANAQASLALDTAVSGSADAVTATSPIEVIASALDPQWLEAIVSDSSPFTSRSS